MPANGPYPVALPELAYEQLRPADRQARVRRALQ
jgi:hypothetical protein